MTLRERFAFNMRRRRLRLAMTQADVAAGAKCALTMVSMMERGDREPSFDMLQRVADALSTSPERLLSEPKVIPEPEDA